MNKDLTTSQHERQNILNNRYALEKAEDYLSLGGVYFKNESIFTKQQVMELFNISNATIERYISTYDSELRDNGYRLLKGKDLKDFKELTYVTLMHEGNKAPVIGVFSFRAVLNLSMLLVESEAARAIRSKLLDIVIDVVAQKSGGQTKYINQRDEDYLFASFQEENYRKLFTEALDQYVDGNQWKYARFTNRVYQSIFHENAAEYKKVLNLAKSDKIRDTMYTEVLNLIASFEAGLAHELKLKSESLQRKLSQLEAENILFNFEQHPLFKPLILDARTKMASRDLCFRDALHDKLEAYIKSVPEADFERFLGEKSRSLEERLSDPETLDVFKRLKDR